jgi:hypothetical protein
MEEQFAQRLRLEPLAALRDWDDPDQLRQVERTLVTMEADLSGYRHDLHERIDACTAELVGRYRSDPEQLRSLGPPSRQRRRGGASVPEATLDLGWASFPSPAGQAFSSQIGQESVR